MLPLVAFAQETDAPTGRIESVVVYPDRAAVTRVVEVEVTPGVNEIAFRDLPPTVDERTIQAEGSGVSGSRLLGLDVVSRELAEDRRARVAELVEQIEAVQDEIRAHSDARAAAEIELAFLRQLQSAAAAQVSAELLFADDTPQHAEQLAELLERRVPEVQAEIRAADVAIREKSEQLSALERERATVEGSAQFARRDVTVQIEVPSAGMAEVRLTYVLPGAAWAPSYDVRAHPDTGKVDLVMNALVSQTSGEDWTGVSLSLSTARPAAGVSPPTLDPFWLQSYYGYGYGYYESGGVGGESYDYDDMATMDSEGSGRSTREEKASYEPPPPEPMMVATATVTERAVASTFEVPGATGVPGDGTRRKVRVTQVELPVEFFHVTVPRYDPSAYLVGKGTWDAGWPLLPGEVASFLEDSFVGSSWIDLHGKGQELELAFGVDDAVQVKSEVVTAMQSNPNLCGKVTAEMAWRYTVTNGRKTPIRIEIRDRVPQSTEAKWKVEYEGDEPTEVEGEGLYTFSRDVAPGAETSVLFGYEIRYPRKYPPGSLE